MRGGLPIVFNFMNNFYGMGGQTAGETMAFDCLARVGAGVNPESMHSERVDGYNPLAVVDAINKKLERRGRTGSSRDDYLPLFRTFSFRCFILPLEGRDRRLAGH